jgi:hypothetical protein
VRLATIQRPVGDSQSEYDCWKNDVLDDVTLCWLTNTAVSSARLFWKDKAHQLSAVDVSIPAAVSAFPVENYQTHEAGRNGLAKSSSIITRLIAAATSRLGNSRRYFQTRFMQASDHCVNSIPQVLRTIFSFSLSNTMPVNLTSYTPCR